MSEVEQSAAAGLERDLERIAERDETLVDGALAATARVLAKAIDDPKNSLTSKAMAAKVVQTTMATLLGLAPVEEKADELDKLKAP